MTKHMKPEVIVDVTVQPGHGKAGRHPTRDFLDTLSGHKDPGAPSRHDNASWDEITKAIHGATAYWNAHRHPFVWGPRRRHRPRRSPGIALLPRVA